MLQLPPPDTKLRCYSILLFDDYSMQTSYEFIGWLVDCEDEWRDCEDDLVRKVSHCLYQDVEGLLHYCVGDEEEVNPSNVPGLSVSMTAYYWTCGKSREKIVAKRREESGTEAVHIPTFLRSPPEIDTMHEESGYDS